MSAIDPSYKQWIFDLKEKVRSAQLKAAVAVNTQLILLYWDLGKTITEKQTAWGTGFLQQLSKDLSTEFPEMKGFSLRNLKYCRNFFEFYNSAKGQQPVALLQNVDVTNSQQLVAHIKNDDQVKSPQLEDEIISQDAILQQAVAKIRWGHEKLYKSLVTDCKELIAMLVSTVKTAKQ